MLAIQPAHPHAKHHERHHPFPNQAVSEQRRSQLSPDYRIQRKKVRKVSAGDQQLSISGRFLQSPLLSPTEQNRGKPYNIKPYLS